MDSLHAFLVGTCWEVDDSFDFTQGKMDAAASMLEKAIVANPTYAEAYNNLGLSLSSLHRHHV